MSIPWSAAGAGVGLFLAVLGLLPALPFGGPLLGALFGPWLGALVVETWVTKSHPGIWGGLRPCATDPWWDWLLWPDFW